MATKEILFATDYSEASKAALPLAASLALQSGATLLIAHVSEREQYPVGELFDDDPHRRRRTRGAESGCPCRPAGEI